MTNLEDFINRTKVEEEVSKLTEATKDARSSIKDAATQKLRELAYATLRDGNFPGIDYSTANPQSISEDHVKIGLGLRVGMAREDSARILYTNRDDVINSIPESSLEEIAMDKTIVQNADPEYGDYLNLYKGYLGTKDLAQRYESGEVSDPKELQLIRSGGARKSQDEIRVKMKSLGYSSDIQQMAGNLALLAARDGYLKADYVEAGANQLVADAEKELRDYETSKGKKAVDYVKGSLTKLVSSNNAGEFETGRNMIYQIAA